MSYKIYKPNNLISYKYGLNDRIFDSKDNVKFNIMGIFMIINDKFHDLSNNLDYKKTSSMWNIFLKHNNDMKINRCIKSYNDRTDPCYLYFYDNGDTTWNFCKTIDTNINRYVKQ